MFRTLLAAFAVGSSALLVSACGGGTAEKVDAEDWVDDLCAATDKLSGDELDAYEEYTALFDGSDDGERIRDGLSDYVKAYNKALDRFERSVDKAGEPDVRDGGKVVDAMHEFVKKDRRVVDRAEKDAKGLDQEGPDLVDAVDEIFVSIEFTDLLKLLEDSDSRDADDIIDLIDEDEECSNFLFLD